MNNSNGLGCLGAAVLVILIIIFIGGNMMFFGSDDIEPNGLFMFIAAVGDIALVCGILYGIGKFTEGRGKVKARNKFHALRMKITDFIDANEKHLGILDRYLESNIQIDKLLELVKSCSMNEEFVNYNELEQGRIDNDFDEIIGNINSSPYCHYNVSKSKKSLYDLREHLVSSIQRAKDDLEYLQGIETTETDSVGFIQIHERYFTKNNRQNINIINDEVQVTYDNYYTEEEIKNKKKTKRIISLTVLFVVICAISSVFITKEVQYNMLKNDIEFINTSDAIAKGNSLSGYRDSNMLVTSLIKGNSSDLTEKYISFGKYKGSKIIWKILDADNKSNVFICVENELFSRPFDEINTTSNVWGNTGHLYPDSSLRAYLNGEFFDYSFNDIEKTMIKETILEDVGVTDKIFLLSLDEWHLYANSQLRSSWLRTAVYKYNKHFIYNVFHDFLNDYNGDESQGVCPALRIDISNCSYVKGTGQETAPLIFKIN